MMMDTIQYIDLRLPKDDAMNSKIHHWQRVCPRHIATGNMVDQKQAFSGLLKTGDLQVYIHSKALP